MFIPKMLVSEKRNRKFDSKLLITENNAVQLVGTVRLHRTVTGRRKQSVVIVQKYATFPPVTEKGF